MSVVVPGKSVVLHFTVRLDSGEVVDTTEGAEPARLVIGDGKLPEGFERVIIGLKQGDIRSAIILPEQGFGDWREENQRIISRHKFSPDLELEEGLVVSFSDVNGDELPGIVASLEGDSVTVDFNHPLAGRELVFEVNIIEVSDPESAVKFDPGH